MFNFKGPDLLAIAASFGLVIVAFAYVKRAGVATNGQSANERTGYLEKWLKTVSSQNAAPAPVAYRDPNAWYYKEAITYGDLTPENQQANAAGGYG